MSSRNSEKAAVTAKIIFPIGVVVSMDSDKLMKPMSSGL
jgi:hypothetical protein